VWLQQDSEYIGVAEQDDIVVLRCDLVGFQRTPEAVSVDVPTLIRFVSVVQVGEKREAENGVFSHQKLRPELENRHGEKKAHRQVNEPFSHELYVSNAGMYPMRRDWGKEWWWWRLSYEAGSR
jgi:hypothetical protein